MKKVLAIVLALAMVFCLVACGEEEVVEAAEYNVGVAIYQFNDNFMTLYRNEIESYFASLETDAVKYNVTIVDGKNDMAEQSNQIDNFITQGMDVIILNLVQTSSAEATINKVVEAGIPLVLINREPLGETDESYPGIVDNPMVCYVGADARQSGKFQGQIVADLENKGDLNGDGVVKYIMIEGDPENPDAQYRTQFSVETLKEASGLEVECLVDQVGNWDQTKGQEICASALAQYGDEIEVVFCNNDGMALGAHAAIVDAGRKVGEDIYLLGVDALEECQQMVAEGEMTGTVLNDHIGQSHTAVDVAIKALNGEAIDNYYWVDYVMVK